MLPDGKSALVTCHVLSINSICLWRGKKGREEKILENSHNVNIYL